MAAGVDWGIVGPVVGTAGSIIIALLKRDADREKRIDALYQKLISDVVPALERATAAAQGFPPILERNTGAMAAMTEATDRARGAEQEMLRLVAVLTDRQARDPGPPHS